MPQKWKAIVLTLIPAFVLTLVGIYAINSYGLALFVLIPILIGFSSAAIYCQKQKDIPFEEVRNIGLLTLLIYTLALIVFAIEGLICIGMAAPFGIIFTLIGTAFGYSLFKSKPNQSLSSIIFLIILIPITGFTERFYTPEVKPVITKIIIEAPIDVVWKNVIAFPTIPSPDEFIFKSGISYPIDSRIEGIGEGAIRYCNFNTGSFVEPITAWEDYRLLAFDVEEQPAPMTELSIWDVDSPHLHDFFVSEKGQFKLTQLPNGFVELEGTTWYYHNIKPDFYWRLWSNMILHKIHNRVLMHIKNVSEHKK